MDYTTLQQMNPHWTRPVDRGQLMEEQTGLVEKYKTSEDQRRWDYTRNMTPDQKMMKEWEKNEMVDDLNEVLYMMYDRGLVDLEWEPTK